MNLPFKYGKVIDDRYFINRVNEIENISKILISKINLVLISPRRWGKSSLMFKVARELEKKNKKVKFCFIDLFSTRNEEEFYNYFATEVLKTSYSKWEERIEKAKFFFKQIIPQFSFGVNPNEQFSVSFNWQEIKKNPREILELPEMISKVKNIHLIVCLDEFQNIAHYEDTLGFQKKLRAVWQHHQHCSYVLYGSKQHMMSELFESKSMPFYKFGETMFLNKIENKEWAKYIQRKFKNTLKKISGKQAGHLANLVENHPYFVQQLANSVWMHTKEICDEQSIEQGLSYLLNQYDIVFSKEIDSLTNLQLNLLQAYAHDEEKVTSKEIIKKYKLTSSAGVIRSKEALAQKEIIDTFGSEITFLDPLFKIWLREVYFRA